MTTDIKYAPCSPRQEMLLNSTADITLGGGAAGGE